MFRRFVALLSLLVVTGCGDSPSIPSIEVPAQDSALLLPWSQLTGRIAIQRSIAGDVVVIDAVRRRVNYMGEFGTYTDGLAVSPDGRMLALGYFLGSAYGNFSGVRVVSTAAATVGKFDDGQPASYRGFWPQWRPNGELSYWRGDTLFTQGDRLRVTLRPPDGGYSWSADESEVFLSYWNGISRTQSVHAFRLRDGRLRDVVRGEGGTYWTFPTAGAHMDSIIAKRAISAQVGPRLGELWMVSADGTGKRLLYSTAVGAFDWSPDGRQLVVAGPPTNCSDCPPALDVGVYLLSLRDGSIRKLMEGPALRVAWGR